MGRPLQTDNSTITAAFRSALNHQLLLLVVLGVLVVVAWNLARTLQYRRAMAAGTPRTHRGPSPPLPEPAARRLLRITFGLLWLLDGLLQAPRAHAPRPARFGDHPGGRLVAGVGPARDQRGHHHLVEPSGHRRGSRRMDPGGYRDLPTGGAPGLLVPGRRGHQRGLGSGGLGVRRGLRGRLRPRQQLVVRNPRWGGVLRGGRGAGGPSRDASGQSPRLGKGVLRGMGVFFVGMGILQAWPGRGFWSGGAHGPSAAGHPHHHGQPDVPGGPALGVRFVGPIIRFLPGRSRVAGQLRGRGPAGRSGCGLPER